MSFGDEYEGGGGRGRGGRGGAERTRTRFPGNEPADDFGDDFGGPARRPPRSSRSLVTVVGVVVLLIAAIAFANRSGGDGGKDTAKAPREGAPPPTAATGTKPVTGKDGTIPAGFSHDEQGAQSAAANYAVALVSAEILKPRQRPEILRRVFVPSKASELEADFARAYSPQFLAKLGLDADGNAAPGMTYVSRTAPMGTKVIQMDSQAAIIEVWCTGVFGTAGVGSTNPVTSDWFTMIVKLQWSGGDWKVESFSQKEGPAPVSADRTASDADEIAQAVEEFGGFTYAR
ncbi:hypothetical protein M4914_10825 [Streptomyces somaliensis DSM 40738]|uniref:DUF8175 domain-containing protein n=1 Tax=Streptomyces somaliensis (strain ATCC 33201 / DSM 40738 / JCM 12659 / KCTC 9044 / NCTC 11332 / NRRL B-12077 / IP 733) TaxID=1134445 RepID=A0AA44DAJ5_STRE0|nr:hypothetical protein [Streptomyces somaliensis]MCQ0023395.1 hypothetical protein [Streptomyces somaliensis DSM 40738]NKY12776.1 hypothetical protein [Streptomyces somaliensis DSM 40738]